MDKVQIGSQAVGAYKLSVDGGDTRLLGKLQVGTTAVGNYSLSVDGGDTRLLGKLQIGSQSLGNQVLQVDGDAKLTGKLQIGTQAASSPYANHALSVDGSGIFKSVVVQASSWADFVFAPDYPLMPLDALRQFIQAHQHLPGLPSEAEVLEQGHLDLAETDKLLLQKIEELTLYLLDMQAENKKLSEKIEALENKINNQ